MTQEEIKILSQMINDTLNVRFDAFEKKWMRGWMA